jgi:uncharacterized protein YecE (DUF72 family)
MAEVLIGTSGYSYHEWVGPVYPRGTRAAEYLGIYAGMFPTVELNFSYYKMPSANQLRGMAEAGPGLRFAIKAHQSLTHRVSGQWQEDALAFRKALEPLEEAGQLEAVLFQFPFSFHYTPENRVYLDKVLAFFKGLPLAAEFRGEDWYTSRVLEGFKKRAVAFAALDLPDLKGNPPVMETVTAPLAYIRMHGRNRETWRGSDAAAKFDYLYSDMELKAWAARIKRIVQQAARCVVYFNNHARGQAAQNAASLMKIIEKTGLAKKGDA